MSVFNINLNLADLTQSFAGVEVEYSDIVNYEIARENICSYTFFLSRQSDNATEASKIQIAQKMNALCYIREHLQIADKQSVATILNELIPLYIAEKRGEALLAGV